MLLWMVCELHQRVSQPTGQGEHLRNLQVATEATMWPLFNGLSRK